MAYFDLLGEAKPLYRRAKARKALVSLAFSRDASAYKGIQTPTEFPGPIGSLTSVTSTESITFKAAPDSSRATSR